MRIFILGGTSGIGLGLAKHYALTGNTVVVAGRTPSKAQLTLTNSTLSCVAVDVRDKEQVKQVLSKFAQEGIDLLIVSAGVYLSARTEKLTRDATQQMLATNVIGVANAFDVAADMMLKQGSGQLVAIASIAGLLKDYPGASVYAATKRSVISLCNTYRIGLAPFGIAVTAIAPGYVDTARLRALNQGDASKKLWLVSEDDAVRRIVKAISERRALVAFPRPMHYLVRAAGLLPKFILSLRR
jgi:NAD(P)-dependent dehydrogenase (short-subunit alcohol dehydrogenase family)